MTAPPSSERTMLVVLDANVWRSTQLLRDPRSAALLYAIKQLDGLIGMPEVIEREVFKHGARMGREARDAIEKNLRTIRALIGQSPSISLPGDEEFESAVSQRLIEIESLFHRVPFTTDVALRALDRVDVKMPPAATTQQFKDSAIWEHCLDWAHEFDVHLVTADKAFYQQNNYQKGLEARLVEELSNAAVGISIHESIEPLLASVAQTVNTSFDLASAADAISGAVLERMRSSVENDGWVLGERSSVQFDAFVTERADTLFLHFSLEFAIENASQPPQRSTALVSGQAMYKTESKAVEDVRLSTIIKNIPTDSGIAERKHVFAYALAAMSGQPPVEYELRAPLPGGHEFRVINVHDHGTGSESGISTELP